MADIVNVHFFRKFANAFFMSFARHMCFHLEPAWKTAFRIYMISAFITIAAANVCQEFVAAIIMIFRDCKTIQTKIPTIKQTQQ